MYNIIRRYLMDEPPPPPKGDKPTFDQIKPKKEAAYILLREHRKLNRHTYKKFSTILDVTHTLICCR